MLPPDLYTVRGGRVSPLIDDSITGTQEIMQQIVDFFTGNAHGEMTPQHHALAQSIITALHHLAPHQYLLPHKITLDWCGCNVSLSFSGEQNLPSFATMEVSRDGDSITTEIDKHRLCSICTVLLIRYRAGLMLSTHPLTQEGRINLKGMDLSAAGRSIFNAWLQDADMESSNLQSTNLWKSDLRGANLRNALLQYAHLNCVDLRRADLQNTSLNYALLQETNLREANLNGAIMEKTNLLRADLRSASLQGSDLDKVIFTGADLSKANLTGARLKDVYLVGANLTDAVLDNIPQTGSLLYLPDMWGTDNLDVLLNHINNPESGSLLTMMDSIEAKYPQIKVKMARELMASLRHTDVSTVAVALLDVLSKAPWSAEPDIDRWLNGICRDYLQYYNTRVMPANLEGVGRQAVNLFSQHPALVHTLNGAFIQLVAQGIAAENDAHRENIRALYDGYLSEETIRPWVMLSAFSDYSGSGRPDWEDSNVANYIHISPVPDGHVMLLSQNTLQGMLAPDPLCPVWDRFYLYTSQGAELPPGLEAPETLFARHFPLFLAPYQYAQRVACFNKLLSLLNLADLRPLFLDVTGERVSVVKLVSGQDQQKLRGIFLPVLEYSTDDSCYNLREAHYCQIIAAYDLTSASDTDKARMLLCLALVFVKYSSSALFGTEGESPEMLRFYACALMEKAYALGQDIFNREEQNQFTGWKNRLLGLNNAFSCSAVLSNMMIHYIRAHFPEVLAQVLPPAWY